MILLSAYASLMSTPGQVLGCSRWDRRQVSRHSKHKNVTESCRLTINVFTALLQY